MDKKQLMEERQSQGLYLAEKKYARYLKPVEEAFKGEGKEITPHLKSTVAFAMENLREWSESPRGRNLIREATYSDDVSKFTNQAFPLIAALMPSLILEELVSMQPMDRKAATIFYLDYVYGQTKGSVTDGDTLANAQTGYAGNQYYSSDKIDVEGIGTGDGSTLVFSGTLGYRNVLPESVTITATVGSATVTITDDGAGNLSGTNVSGTINYDTGAWALTFVTTAPDDTTPIEITYRFNMEKYPDGVGQIDLVLRDAVMTAVARKLRARWFLDAAWDLQKAHGKDADVELTMALTEEIKAEIDASVIYDLVVGGYGSEYTWDKTPPAAEVPYNVHKYDFINTLVEMSNDIYGSTQRAYGNWIVAGLNVCNIIETYDETNFRPAGNILSNPQAGPHFIGVLANKWKVYKHPKMVDSTGTINADAFAMGFKGENYLNAGYVYGSYMPIFLTPAVMLDDFQNRKGIMTSAGKKFINNRFYRRGKVIQTTP